MTITSVSAKPSISFANWDIIALVTELSDDFSNIGICVHQTVERAYQLPEYKGCPLTPELANPTPTTA
jgi:hypothetical protein